MRKLFLAFMLLGTFAFANNSLTNFESFTDPGEFYTLGLCDDEYYVYFEGELVAEWTEPAPLDENMECTGRPHIYFL